MNIEEFETKLQPFGFNDHQDFLTYILALENLGLTIEDVKEYVKQTKKSLLEQEQALGTRSLKCKECGTMLGIYSVNTGSRDQTGDDSKSVGLCTNEDCRETIYSTKTPTELIKYLSKEI